jgi:hypothetical protein
MNNYHLFLIRSDQVTQILTHLAAGIATLVLISSLGAPQGEHLSGHRPAEVAEIRTTMPEGTEMIASTQ